MLYDKSASVVYDLKHNILNMSIVDPMDERCIARGNFTGTFENYVLMPALNWQTKPLDNYTS